MATHLDLQEQEQLDQLKHFWHRYGTVVVSILTVVLLAYAAWNGWQWYQREQSTKASVLFEELERTAQTGDTVKLGQVFSAMKDRYPQTVWALQSALLTAQVQQDKGQGSDARASLEWVVKVGKQAEYQWVARLRLAGLWLEADQADAALKALTGEVPAPFEGLVADRRGDILAVQGKREEAVAAYQEAWRKVDAATQYRRLVEAKLLAAGAAPQQVVPAVIPASGGVQ